VSESQVSAMDVLSEGLDIRTVLAPSQKGQVLTMTHDLILSMSHLGQPLLYLLARGLATRNQHGTDWYQRIEIAQHMKLERTGTVLQL
jgi:hypothetical protein